MTVLLSELDRDLVGYVQRDETAPIQHYEFLLKLAHWNAMWCDVLDRRN